MRVPVLNRLLAADGAFDNGRLRLDPDFGGVGSPVIFTGAKGTEKPFWAFAHLDTISYLVQPEQGGRVPLVPYCVHLMHDGECPANAYSYDLESNRYRVVAEGRIEWAAGSPFFRAKTSGAQLAPGGRIAPFSSFKELGQGGLFTGPWIMRAASRRSRSPRRFSRKRASKPCWPFQTRRKARWERGTKRCAGAALHRSPSAAAEARDCRGCPAGRRRPGRRHEGGVENSTRLGAGALLAEFSSLARGAVTPLGLYGLADAWPT